MLLFLFLCGLALGAVTPSEGHPVKLQRGGCPPFWFSFNGRCYKYVATHLTWADAELYCRSERANLVSIYSTEEQNFIKSLIKNFDHTEGFTLIGLSDLHKEGGWMWSDGCPVGFTFWREGEPNNSGGTEHCGHTNLGTEKKWNDIACSRTYPSICATRVTCPEDG